MPRLRFELMVDAVPMMENRLKLLRDAKGLTQEALGDLAGFSHSTIQRLEHGKIRMTEHHVTALARALGVDPVELIIDPARVARSDLEKNLLEAVRNLPQSAVDDLLRLMRNFGTKSG